MAKLRKGVKAKLIQEEPQGTPFPHVPRRPSMNLNASQQVSIKLILLSNGFLKVGVNLTGIAIANKPMSLGVAKLELKKIGRLSNMVFVPDLFLPLPKKTKDMLYSVQRKNPLILGVLNQRKKDELVHYWVGGGGQEPKNKPNDGDKGEEKVDLPSKTGEK